MDLKIKENIQKYFSMMGDQIYTSNDKKSDSDTYDDQTSVVRTHYSNRDIEEQPPVQFYSNMTVSQSATNGLRDSSLFY